MWLYRALDVFFFVFHTGLIVFIVAGWAFRRTRRAHLVLVALTGLSWFGLGLWYGIGYCPSTDWHWMVRRELGYGPMPYSYLKFLFDAATGLDVDARAVDATAFAVFAIAAGLSLALNWMGARGKNA